VYVTEVNNHRVQKFNSTGGHLMTFGSNGSAAGQFKSPQGIVVNAAGDIFVADGLNHRIQKFNGSGGFLAAWGSFGSGAAAFRVPQGLALDGSGNLYAVDQGNHRVQKFDANGTHLGGFGMFGTANGQFTYPQGIAISDNGSIFVVSLTQHHVQKFDASGTFLEKWGTNGAGDGQFSYPGGIAVDQDAIYVVDGRNHRVQKFIDPTPRPIPGTTPILTQMDIVPGLYPNRVEPDLDLVVRVALLGNSELNLADVDLSSIRLNGSAPTGSHRLDAGAAIASSDDCYTSNVPIDGVEDIVLEFQTTDLSETMPLLEIGETDLLTLTGRLLDGTPFVASDCILMAGPQLEAMRLYVMTRPPGMGHLVQYSLPKPGRVSITVLDVAGRVVDRIANDWYAAGSHDLVWPARGLASGVYFVRMSTDEGKLVKQVAIRN
jgi:sugar lactone lactonase YvrE